MSTESPVQRVARPTSRPWAGAFRAQEGGKAARIDASTARSRARWTRDQVRALLNALDAALAEGVGGAR